MYKTIIKYLFSILLFLFLLTALSIPYAMFTPQSPLVQGVQSNRILIHNIKILSRDFDRLLKDRSIIIEDGIIQESPVSENFIQQDFDLIIDGNNQFLMPGLTDAHTHIYDRTDLLLNLAHGVTQVRVMHGLALQLNLREEIQSGDTLGPNMLVASPAINQRSSYAASEFHTFIENEEDTKGLIDTYKSHGYDLIKIYDGLDNNNFQAILSAANKLEIPVAGHPPFAVNTSDLLSSGMQSVEHIEMLYQAPLNYSRDKQDLDHLIQQLKQSPVPITTTLIVYEELARIAELKSKYLATKQMEYIPPIIKSIFEPGIQNIMTDSAPESWRSKADYLGIIAKSLYEADVPMLLGSDAGANYTINGLGAIQEMQLLHHYGVDPKDILKSATITPAIAFKLHNSGTVAPGHKANLILTKSDPRKDLGTFMDLQGLIKDGVYFDEKAIKQMKLKSKTHMSSYEFLGWYLINWWQE
ncbi:amidohydrolase family protein [Kangiella koreensis]|uniref:Amidohydrolase n=1 Tax=Kangiella koreensis (strain DSM 16069 / JCM 12317 / KCTC 12182 / SW-125) TaxID=523791 RepID=C7R735_KANKD|nr:amidohydrolase family protein [Kangiella koreensis]ACV27491.1 amidohydrolase [Kangiella koreensis DSM 16069]